MSEGVYDELRKLLDCHPVGCESTPEILQILKILFTDEEAKVALGLGFIPFTVEDIARRAGVEPTEAQEKLESLAQKGYVFARKKDGVWGYALQNAVVLFEMLYRKGLREDIPDGLTALWEKHHTNTARNTQTKTPMFRVIPVQKKIVHSPEVLPYSKVEEMIDNAKVLGITHCACREFSQNCDAPRETCMQFDTTCTFMVERGFGRYITKEEMKEKLVEFDKLGLFRQVNNTTNRLEFICNCCPCCCLVLRKMMEFKNPYAFIRSPFIPVLDETKCDGCAICADERCPTKAIEMVDNKPILEIERCIGCGLCASGCPTDAWRMEKLIEVPEALANTTEWGMKVLQERGKLEAFMKTMSTANKR
nr:4Fe-4S binding protein [Deltaproteobacteria bacterium]